MAVPSAPTIRVVSTGNGVLQVRITSVPNATSYKLYRDTFSPATTLLASGVTALVTYHAATAGVLYWMRAKATNADGDSAFGPEVTIRAGDADTAENPSVALKIARKLITLGRLS